MTWIDTCITPRAMPVLLTDFEALDPVFQVSRPRSHTWLAAVTAEIEDIAEVIDDGTVIYDLPDDPRNAGPGARARLAGEILDKYFTRSYAPDASPPDELIHVTCGGSVSPSGAERMVRARGWSTRVTHLYRQGCHAAVPAIRAAAARLREVQRVDVAHTELASFGAAAARDGMIRYAVVRERPGAGLHLLATHERALDGVVGAFTRAPATAVPTAHAAALRGFVHELFERAGTSLDRLATATLAVHPNDAWVLDRVIDALALRTAQLDTTRRVLRERGELQSATLPHIWKAVLDDPAIAPATLIPSFAFGPGPTLWGALLEKHAR